MSTANISPDTKFFVASVAYSPTLRTIMECTDNVYGFNPVDDSAKGPLRISKVWEWMNDKMEFEHGGARGCAVNLAASLYYQKVGLLGYGLYEKPNPQWTLDEAKEREYIYYPDTDEVCAIPRHFKAYLAHILWTVQSTSWTEWFNLSDTPLFRHSPLLKQSTVDEFGRDETTTDVYDCKTRETINDMADAKIKQLWFRTTRPTGDNPPAR
jgi:hypothetical protein